MDISARRPRISPSARIAISAADAVLTCMTGGDEVLVPVLNPLDAGAEELRRRAEDDILPARGPLQAEPAAHIRPDDPHQMLGLPDGRADEEPQQVRRLAGHLIGEHPRGRVEERDTAAGLDGHRGPAMLAEGQAHHPVGRLERGIHIPVPALAPEHDVARHLIVQQRSGIAGGRVRGDDGRERIQVQVDQAGGVLGDVPALRDDERDGIADVTDAITGQRGVGRRRQAVDRDAEVKRIGAVGKILRGEHGMDTREGLRRGGVHAAQYRVGDRAAHEAPVQQPRGLDVVHVSPAAGEDARILLPRHPRAGQAAHHASPRVHAVTSASAPLAAWADRRLIASSTPSMIVWYPEQRQTLPDR